MRLLALAFLLVGGGAQAQTAPGTAPGGPQSNFVDRLLAVGDTLWAGPRLVFTPDGGQTWIRAEGEDAGIPVFQPPQAPNATTYALAARGDLVWVGLGYRDPSPPTFAQSAAGFAFSQDGGQTWSYRFPQLDQPQDTTQIYGVTLLPAVPVVVPQLSAPFGIAIDPTTRDVWVAGTLSGARRLRFDPAAGTYARRFERVVLPPDTLLSIHPTEPQAFPVGPPIPGLLDFSTNSIAYSVLADETGTIWVGTEAGLNRSGPEDVFFFQDPRTGRVFDDRAWRRTPFDGTVDGLVGRAVIALAEQPLGDASFPTGSPENPRNPVWVASWTPVIQGVRAEPGERSGVAVTRDGGETFEPVLVGERVYGFAFCEAGFAHCAEGTVWAASADGLFASEDGGQTWSATRSFRDRDRAGRFVKAGAETRAVAATSEALWVGTTDGLLKSTDGGQTWSIFRTDVPVQPAEPTARTPEVDAYAYPNPFSPRADRIVRIRYERDASRIRILDFGMNLVRMLDAPAPGEQAWDGLDDAGARVPNGVYFYAVEAGGETLWGKIVVLE